jgi:hypothetical protein
LEAGKAQQVLVLACHGLPWAKNVWKNFSMALFEG